MTSVAARPLGRKRLARARKIDRQQSELIRGKLEGLVPSTRWREDLHSEFIGGFITFKSKLDRELDRVKVFPPGGKKSTLMKVCRCCGRRWYPPQYMTLGTICADCIESRRAPPDPTVRQSRGSGRTIRARAYAAVGNGAYEVLDVDAEDDDVEEPTTCCPVAVAMMEMEKRGVVLEELPLMTESTEILKEQIQRYLDGKPTTLISAFSEPQCVFLT